MGLCLANSLVSRRNYVPYDQLVRYKWWHKDGYMSSTGNCFDIGAATKNSLVEFERRQKKFAKAHKIPFEEIDYLSNPDLLKQFDVNCSAEGVAGNGALMRLAPVPLFFYRDPIKAVEYSGQSGEITHGDKKAYDACRYYGALIVAAVNAESRDELLDRNFYENHKDWFGDKPLHPDIMKIAHGSYQREEGYDDGIRGKGYIVSALEAVLWAFWSEEKQTFEEGALAAVNLGDDTDTTAAIYGQLAGAYYGFSNLPERWKEKVYAKGFIECLSKWIVYEGEKWSQNRSATSSTPPITVESPSQYDGASPFEQEINPNTQSASVGKKKHGSELSTKEANKKSNSSSKFEQSTNSGSNDRLRRISVDPTPNLRPNAHQQPAMARPGSAEHDKSKQTTGHVPISSRFFWY
jgi:ADP-ribosylglycohydrolase